MVDLSYSMVSENIDPIPALADVLKPKPLMFYPYLSRNLKTEFEKIKPQFPMDIKIPKENKYLLRGDYEPAYIIHLDKPLTRSDGTPMWFESSEDGVKLRFGYKNCDARFPSDFPMNMKYIHLFLGGSSGQGKSVTINSALASMFYEYAPWELEVHMSDAKIAEFKKYGVNHRIPHISSIAATGDADFVISVLRRAKREMDERAKIFGALQVSNLKEFREKTGLAMPRVLVVMDEVESTFVNAGKKANEVGDLIDAFARLGRAAGYHLFLATQNLSSAIPKSALGQIAIRCCLGANEATSIAVLGNNGACQNMGRIGRMIMNTTVLNGGNTLDNNVTFQTPFLSGSNFQEEMKELEDLGKSVGFKKNMAFYDEEDIKTLETYGPIIDKLSARPNVSENTVYLGYPAFVTDDEDGMLKINFDFKDVENVCICSTKVESVSVLLNIFRRSLSKGWNFIHLTTDIDQLQYTPNIVQGEECRDALTGELASVSALVRKRLFLLALEQRAVEIEGIQFDREKVEKILEEGKVPKEYWGNGLMLRRALLFSQLNGSQSFKTVWEPVSAMFPSFKNYYHECEKCNSIIEPITKDKFGKVMYFIGDLSKIIGYGRDTNTKQLMNLKKAMQDSCRANIVFVVYSRSMEGINDLVSGLRYTLFDVPDSRDWGRLRSEAPAELNEKLVILFDSLNTTDPQLKFKRTKLKEDF